MAEINSTKLRTSNKPEKPSSDFPLFAHNNGRWAKKVKGKMHHFGPWSNPQAALERWLAKKDYLLAGQEPPATKQTSIAERPRKSRKP